MKVTDKNDFIVKNKGAKFFERDLALFKKHCPHSRLNDDLKRVNSFTIDKLDALMLYELLNVVTPEVIFKNRKTEIKEAKDTTATTAKKVESKTAAKTSASPKQTTATPKKKGVSTKSSGK